jgi:hypothetical protein
MKWHYYLHKHAIIHHSLAKMWTKLVKSTVLFTVTFSQLLILYLQLLIVLIYKHMYTFIRTSTHKMIQAHVRCAHAFVQWQLYQGLPKQWLVNPKSWNMIKFLKHFWDALYHHTSIKRTPVIEYMIVYFNQLAQGKSRNRLWMVTYKDTRHVCNSHSVSNYNSQLPKQWKEQLYTTMRLSTQERIANKLTK